MRKFWFFFFIICIFGTNVLHAQRIDSGPISGGGPLRLFEGTCVTPQQREIHRARVQRNIDSLRARGKLPQEFAESRAVLELQWPITSSLSDYGYQRMGHFPDHDKQSNSLLDYMCHNRTYDRSSDGYDHRGTNIFGWPFNWHQMDNDEIQVIAAAAGEIVDKEDGNFDRECATINSGNTNWNDITIVHSDGSEAWFISKKTR